MQDIQAENEARDMPARNRKPYETPALTVHGTVAQITKSLNPGTADGLSGSLNVGSDRGVKQNFAAVDPQDVLRKLLSIPVESWSYNFQDPSIRHIGPMAQDFAAAFGVGEDDKHINMVDANGVTVAAIQALHAMVQQRDTQINEMRQEIDALSRKLAN